MELDIKWVLLPLIGKYLWLFLHIACCTTVKKCWMRILTRHKMNHLYSEIITNTNISSLANHQEVL